MESSHKRATALSSFNHVVDYRDAATFRQSFDFASQVATYSHKHSNIDVLFAPSRSSRRLAVFFNSQQKSRSLKMFTWQKASRDFVADRLFISDPTVYAAESLNLGWYLGTSLLNMQTHITELIDFFASSRGTEEIIFFGSSGGGFPALLYSQTFDNAIAVTMAPTTTVRHHSNPVLVNAWLQHAHSIIDGNFERLPDDLILDLAAHYDGRWRNPAIILQNRTDEDFRETQTLPLLSSLGGALAPHYSNAQNLHVFLEDYGHGHVMPPSTRLSQIAQDLSSIPEGKLVAADYQDILWRSAVR